MVSKSPTKPRRTRKTKSKADPYAPIFCDTIASIITGIEANQARELPPAQTALEREQRTGMAGWTAVCRKEYEAFNAALESGDPVACAEAGFNLSSAIQGYNYASAFEVLTLGVSTLHGQRVSLWKRQNGKHESDQERELIAEWNATTNPTANGVAVAVQSGHLRKVKDRKTGEIMRKPQSGWGSEKLRKMIPTLLAAGKIK